MAYADAKHRPHAVHTGETPLNIIDMGPTALRVRLDTWGPEHMWATNLYDKLQSNWGDAPERSRNQPCRCAGTRYSRRYWPHVSGYCRLTSEQQDYVESAFAGKTLQQAFELLTFSFMVDGCTRAFTHEFVRARLGAGFMQHGGRDNDWRHRNWSMPETIRRAVNAFRRKKGFSNDATTSDENDGRLHCIVDWNPIEHYLEASGQDDLLHALSSHLSRTKSLYAALVDAGIPWQDARRLLPIGTQTYIHGDVNYVALKGVLGNRLEHIMDWEINCVAQLMLRELHIHCPPLFTKYLGSHSDMAKRAMFERLESWPPDGKWPGTTLVCAHCDHAEGNHRDLTDDGRYRVTPLPDEKICEVCERDGDRRRVAPMHRFKPKDTLPRQHRREQMPFFVLHPDSMKGAPVKWLWTNGSYSDIRKQLEEPVGHSQT